MNQKPLQDRLREAALAAFDSPSEDSELKLKLISPTDRVVATLHLDAFLEAFEKELFAIEDDEGEE